MTATAKLNLAIEFESVTCGVCGFQFAVPTDVHHQWRRTGENFHCPKGDHWLHYGNNENDRLRIWCPQAQQVAESATVPLAVDCNYFPTVAGNRLFRTY